MQSSVLAVSLGFHRQGDNDVNGDRSDDKSLDLPLVKCCEHEEQNDSVNRIHECTREIGEYFRGESGDNK